MCKNGAPAFGAGGAFLCCDSFPWLSDWAPHTMYRCGLLCCQPRSAPPPLPISQKIPPCKDSEGLCLSASIRVCVFDLLACPHGCARGLGRHSITVSQRSGCHHLLGSIGPILIISLECPERCLSSKFSTVWGVNIESGQTASLYPAEV